jgi:hypothetical protein
MKRQVFRRLTITALLVSLLAITSVLQLENAQLANAVEAKSRKSAQLPKTEPIDPPPPVVEPVANIEQIRAKLLADGCNFNSDTGVVRQELGTCKVLLIGDSLGNNLGYGMISQVTYKKDLILTRKAKASTGLSNPWFYNWHNNQAAFLKEYKPNLVIVFLGANDRQNYVINGVTQTFGTTSWKNTYRSNIKKLATAATKSGAYVLWVGMPIMKPFNYAKGETLIDEQFALTVPKVPGATYLPTRAFTADAAGNYRQIANVNGKPMTIRGDDGIHFSSMGQNVIATYVINAINRIYNVKLTSSNARYITK